jgi:benzoate/toluate 1,2-dioxygenase beta subunit
MRFEEWLNLFTDDGLYWLPTETTAEPGQVASLINDDSVRRQERVFRLLHTPAHSQMPPSRTLHIVANVEIEAVSDAQVRIYSNQIIYELRRGDYRQVGLGEQRTFSGRCEHRLRRENGTWRIALKKVVLLNADLPVSNLTFMI